MTTKDTLALFAGNANLALAQDIARHLQTRLGDAEIGHFSDGECRVELMENARGRDVFVIQPTCPPTKRHSDGVARDGGCAQACLRSPDHRRDAVFRLCAAGSQAARDALAHHGEARGKHDFGRQAWVAW